MATEPSKQPEPKPAAVRGARTAVRKRSVRKPAAESASETSGRPIRGAKASVASRASGRQAHQIAILVVAIVCGLIGLAVHIFALAAIVLMSILLGLIAAGMRNRRDMSVFVELATEAKSAIMALTGRG